MSDTSDPDQPTKSSPDDSVTVFGSEIDDDWGEAFEDDFMDSPDEDTSSEFFLEDDGFESTSEPEEDEASEESSPDLVSDSVSSASFVSQYLLKFSVVFTSCKNWVISLPLQYRIPVLVLPLIVIVLSINLLISSPPPDPPPESAGINETDPASDQSTPQVSSEEPIAVIDEKVRKKWSLPPFLISTNDNMKGDDIFFVEVDITLILLLESEESVPNEKSVIVRDIIYQFFNNRPLYELRRFSLARSEMNRKLLSWLEKQWHHDQIASIVFNRYRVL